MAAEETALRRLREKLHPNRFTGMSGCMAAIVGCVLDQIWSAPVMAELCITSDRCLLARRKGDLGFNDFIGSAEDLARNLRNLWLAAELDPNEIALFRARFTSVCQGWQCLAPVLWGIEEYPEGEVVVTLE